MEVDVAANHAATETRLVQHNPGVYAESYEEKDVTKAEAGVIFCFSLLKR